MSSSETSASLLPLIPRIFFVYLEPAIIIAGMLRNHAARLPLLATLPLLSPISTSPIPMPLATLLSPSLCASYLSSMLLYGLLVLLVAPPSRRLAQLHIAILVVADFTHWAAVVVNVAEAHPGGWAGVGDVGAWDEEMRMMVYGPMATFAIKVATLAGWFGEIREPGGEKVVGK